MKILFVSQYFYPETFRGNDICFELAQKGYEVTVLAGIPNYPQGSFFSGYGLFKRRKETINGVKVLRVPIIPRGTGNKFQLVLNYFSYPLVASFYTIIWAFMRRFDKVFVQQLSPVMISIPAIVYKKIHKVPLYTWVLDLWPESLVSAGGINNKHIVDFFDKVARCEYRNSDKILVSSNAFSKSILQRGDYKEKIKYFPNWAESVFDKKQAGGMLPVLPKGFIVMFAGNIGEAQDFEHILLAADMLKDNENIKFVFVGDGRKKTWVDECIAEYGLEKTVFTLGRYPIEVMPSFFEEADVMLVTLKDELVFNLTAPAKIQAYMAASKPIMAMLNGEGAELVEKSQCGFSVAAGDSEALKMAILELYKLSATELSRLGENGFIFYKQNFDKEVCMNNLLDLMND